MVKKSKNKSKKKKNDDKCFQYAVTVALNHKQIENQPKRVTEILSLSWINITGKK